jgi:hypothetical protein
MSPERVKELRKLIKRWTKAEILSRLGKLEFPEYADYAVKKLDWENEIRELLYGTSDLVQLGIEWGLIDPRPTRREDRKKMNQTSKHSDLIDDRPDSE